MKSILLKSIMVWRNLLTIMLLTFFINVQAQYPAGSPVAINGKLKVVGTQLSNECGNPVQLRGMSSHGPQWFQSCYTNSALDALASSWGIDVFRIAMYVQEGGYVNDPAGWKTWIDNMVDACGARGIYCIIDWHVLNPGDPNANITEARDFWSYMSAKHSAKKHVLYEICNEPNGVTWSTIKTYANDIIPRIRANDANTVIIVGTPTWSQDVDIASADKLNFSNLMYTLHFYSGTHTSWLRDKGNTAMANGAALFVTEFGTSQASGDGGPYLDETQNWMDWMAANKISWVNWSFADKSEVSAALSPGACSGGSWNNTTTSGTFIKQHILSPADNFVCNNNSSFTISASSGTGGTITPSGSVSVASGTSKTFTIAASSGYQINSVTVDGASVGAVSTYTFTNVTANHTIAASFSAVTNTQKAYPNGVDWAIPGSIEAVNYDIGGEGVAYHDTTVGNSGTGPRSNENVDTEFRTTAGNVGWIAAGEWLEYTVNVSQTASYDIAVQVASDPGGGSYHIEFNGVNKTGVKTVGATGGWGTFITQNITGISLTAGEQVMRVYFDGGNFNLGTMTFAKSGSTNHAPVAKVAGTPLSGAAPLAVSLDASGSTDADGDVLSYAWTFGDNTTGSGAKVSHTYSTSGSYVATVTVTDGKGGSSQASVTISVTGGTNNCKFGTPRASALPSINAAYNHVYVLGSGGPNLSNVTNFTINWDLPNNGLWQYSMNTSNGVPNWYVDLRTSATYNFNQAQPKITLTNSGFAGLDGQYYVNTVGSDFVMVSATANYTLYFTNATTAPSCTARVVVEENQIESSSIVVGPNPSRSNFKIKLDDVSKIRTLQVYDAKGSTMRLNFHSNNNNEISFGEELNQGFYILRVDHVSGMKVFRLIKE